MNLPLGPRTVTVSLDAKLSFLRQPGSYPEPACRVEAIETHMSWVFLTDSHAYKLKKPVRYPLLDFDSIEARRFYCEEEVRLNRRLAPDVYLGTVALVVNAGGHLELDGTGMPVDYLVRMRRLSSQRMLDHAILCGTAREQDITRIAALLVRFHDRCARIDIDVAGYRRILQSDIEQSRVILNSPAYALPAEEVERACNAQQALLARIAPLLDQRVRLHKIVEGHGDLRAEHVCLEAAPVIIDCLEFSPTLRMIDTIDEVAFLALECERLGAPHFSRLLLQTYCELGGDVPHSALIHFYQAFRATLRARIAILHLDEEKFRLSTEWPRRAMAFLVLAQQHARAAEGALTTQAAR